MQDRYATVSFPTFEFQKGGEPLLPPKVSPVPDKSNGVQASLAFNRYKVCTIALNGYPLAEFEIAFHMMSRRTTVTLAPTEFGQCAFGGLPFACRESFIRSVHVYSSATPPLLHPKLKALASTGAAGAFFFWPVRRATMSA